MSDLIIIPEYKLLQHVEKCLAFIRSDYVAQADKNNSYLMRVLNGNAIERYDLKTQAKKVFIDNDVTNDRFLETNLMFNMKREGLPTIHITLPSEQTQMGGNGVGVDQGYREQEILDEGKVTEKIFNVFTRRFQSTYNIVITSDNSNEVIMIYHVIRALLISTNGSLHLTGLENINTGGQDVQLYQGMANKNMYVRAITVGLQYETSAPDIWNNPIFKDLFATGTPKSE